MFSQEIIDFGRKPNVIRDLSAYAGKRKQEIGAENVFDFSIGSPNVPAPREVHEAILDLIQNADPVAIHAYTGAAGDPAVRKVIADHINKSFGDHVDPSGIYITAGASGAIAAALKGLTVPGDEVIIFTPHYMEYLIYTEAYGAKPVVVRANEDTFQIDVDRFAAAVTEKTKVVILNSPNNPSGVIYTEDTIKAVTDLMKRKEAQYGHPIFLLSDEPYRELAYDNAFVPYLMNYYDDTLVCYSYSKTLSIPGERMGYLAICKRCAAYRDVVDACAGAARALGHICVSNMYQRVIARCVDVVADVGYYKRNRDLLVSSLEEMGFTCVHPDGAFYLFMKSPTADSMEFCQKAKEFELMLVPGHDFGVPDYLRVSYCVAYETIERSLPAFRKLAAAYGLGK